MCCVGNAIHRMKSRKKEQYRNYFTTLLKSNTIQEAGVRTDFRSVQEGNIRRGPFILALSTRPCFRLYVFKRDVEMAKARWFLCTCTHPQYVHANYTS